MIPHHGRAFSLLDLPPEILDLITLIIYENGSESACPLKPLSCTCRHLRRVAIPLLFQTRTARCLRLAFPHGWGIYIPDATMMCHAEHIRELRIVIERHSSYTDYPTHYSLQQFVKRMTKLQTIRSVESHCGAVMAVQGSSPIHVSSQICFEMLEPHSFRSKHISSGRRA